MHTGVNSCAAALGLNWSGRKFEACSVVSHCGTGSRNGPRSRASAGCSASSCPAHTTPSSCIAIRGDAYFEACVYWLNTPVAALA